MANPDSTFSPDDDDSTSGDHDTSTERSERRSRRVDKYRQAGLSQRQAEVQTLREAGLARGEIATELDLAVGTVESHCDRIDYTIRRSRHLVTLADRVPSSLTATEFVPDSDGDGDEGPTLRGWSLATGADEPEYDVSYPIDVPERTVICDQCGFVTDSVAGMMDHLEGHR